MTAFLFIISFLLHIISITAIYALSKQLSGAKGRESKEVVALMESYLEEIKEENRQLQDKITNRETETKAETDKKEDIVESTILPIQGSEVQDEIEVSLQSKILMMHQQGLSAEEIARELGCGKTEIDLILKFNKKNDINA